MEWPAGIQSGNSNRVPGSLTRHIASNDLCGYIHYALAYTAYIDDSHIHISRLFHYTAHWFLSDFALDIDIPNPTENKYPTFLYNIPSIRSIPSNLAP